MKKLFLILAMSTVCFYSCKDDEDLPSPGGGGTGGCDYTQWTGTSQCSEDYYPVYNNSCCPSGYPFYNTSTSKCYVSCDAANNASSSGSVYRYNTSGGGGGGGNTGGYNCVSGDCQYVTTGGQYATLSACESACGGGGSGGNDCTNMTSYTSATAKWISNCGGTNEDLSVKVTNNSNQTLYIRIEIEKTNGKWDCGGETIPPGDYTTYWSCDGTGNYKWRAILGSEFGNGCFPDCGD